MDKKSSKKISVVMTTYNGEKYVKEQIESILRQTLPPDEVVICDDGSTDSTCTIIQHFIAANHLDNWILRINENNIGWKKNFYKATQISTGDIIFFSDQDDVWINSKIETMVLLMSTYKMDCLFSEKNIIDSDGKPMPQRMERAKFSGEVRQIAFSNSFCHQKTLGCCMCINRHIASIYLEMSYPEGGHDSQCGRIALLCGTLWHIDAPLINYRIHGENSSGIQKKGSYGRSSLQKRIENIQSSLEWLSKSSNIKEVTSEKRFVVRKSMEMQNIRLDYMKGKRLFFSLFSFFSYYSSISMMIGDFMYKHKMNIWSGTLLWNFKKYIYIRNKDE